MRFITLDSTLYTEMVVDRAIVHGDENVLKQQLHFDEAERPLALQVCVFLPDLAVSDPRVR